MSMRTRKVWSTTCLPLAIGLALQLSHSIAAENRHTPEARWGKDIAAFEAADKTNPPPQDAVLFLGSSTIRRWTNLAQSFPGHKVINRGFGGSEVADSVAFADRIVLPYRPKLILLYAGDNDIAAGKSPETVFSDFKAFVQKVQAALPDTHIGYLAIKPCPAREKFLDQVKTANRFIRDYCATNDRLLFIDVFTPMLSPEGRPRADWFVSDGLHPNAQAYALWASILRPVLDRYDPPNDRGMGR